MDTRYLKDLHGGVEQTLSEDIGDRVVAHRNMFSKIFKARLAELLPHVITWQGTEGTAIDGLKIEVALRNNVNAVVGCAKNGEFMLLGQVLNPQSTTDPSNFWNPRILTKNDIKFFIPHYLIPDEMLEITPYDNCQTGNFVVLRNKPVSYINDQLIINHYADRLTEIVCSRFSLSIQAKVMTFFIGEEGDETLNQLITNIYNGKPFNSVTEMFEPLDQIIEVNNANVAANLVELKREYQNIMSEFLNIFGLNSLAVDKEAGVSESEAKSNSAFTTANGNIYLEGRNRPLHMLNKRYPELNILCVFNDKLQSELTQERTVEEFENNHNA